MKLTLEQAIDLAYWAEIVASHAKNYQGMMTFSQSPEVFHEGMMYSLRKPLENLLKSLPAELLAEINGNAQVETIEPTQADTGRKPTPRDFAIFEDVASALGHVEAERQLQRVLDDLPLIVDLGATHLRQAFSWKATPQVYGYWFDVSAEIEKLKA